MANREIEARLKISAVDRTGNVLKQVAGRLQQMNRRAADFNRAQSVMARTAQTAGAMMMRYAAPAALAYGAKAAFTSFAEVERRMTRIGITAGATREETSAAFESLQRQAKAVSMTVDPAVAALDALTASGMDMKQAMDFMPSVLATAQASGAATEDIANTAMKTASALGLQADQMQKAFDIMVTGGKLGQFELKDMAQYIPALSNSFASLGYKGEDGLKYLIAMLQTIREDTGDASSAATQAQNIFGKMYSEDTAKKFKKFGIDLRKELKAAEKSGEGSLEAFVRLSRAALKGDLSKLPLLFTDQEYRLGMQSLITSGETLKRVLGELSSEDVAGTVGRDLKIVMEDAQASIDRMANSWEKLKNSFGGAVAPGAASAMDAVSSDIDYGEAVRRTLKDQGMGYWERESWLAKEMPLGSFSQSDAADEAAYKGGYGSTDWRDRHAARTLRGMSDLVSPDQAEFPGGALKRDAKGRLMEFPVPGSRPDAPRAFSSADIPALPRLPGGLPAQLEPKKSFRDMMKIDVPDFKPLTDAGSQAGQSVADGGQQAGESIKESATFIRGAGYDVSAAIANAAQQLIAAAKTMNNLGRYTNPQGGGRPGVNANVGSTVPPLTP